jgi:hypothetical protein
MQNEGLKTGKFSGQPAHRLGLAKGGRTASSEQKKYSIYDPVLMDVGGNTPATVDFSDALKLRCIAWHFDGRYVKSSGGHSLHRVVKIIPKDKVIHHCDQDPMNNQQYNLEEKSGSVHNQRHNAKKEICGVSGRGKKYAASINNFKQKRAHLGTYDTPQEAGMVYDWAARILHGDGCLLNFPGRICPALAAFLIRSSGGKSFDVTFVKRGDGHSRTMRCHIANPSPVPSCRNGRTSPALPDLYGRRRGPGPYSGNRLGLIVVCEDGCLGYKMIPVEGITQLTIGGKNYEVRI